MGEDDCDDDDTCEFVFKPQVWEEKYGPDAIPNEKFCCKHPPAEGFNRCKYHIKPGNREEIDETDTEIFLDLLSGDYECERIFGARFQDIQVEPNDLRAIDRDWANLRNVAIDSSLKINGGEINFNITFDSCDITGYREYDTTVEARRLFKRCYLRGSFKMRFKSITSQTEFRDSVFNTALQISGNFKDKVLLNECSLHSGMAVWKSKFNEDLSINDGSVTDDLIIDNTEFDECFEVDSTSLPDVTIISGCDIDTIQFNPSSSGECDYSLIDFQGDPTLHSGSLLLGQFEAAYYDLSNATIGDINLSDHGRDLSNYYFEDTRFEDFDFFPYRTHLEREDFYLHTFDFPYSEVEDHQITNYSQLSSQNEIGDGTNKCNLKDQEETYARAKNQAEDLGASHFASKFFINQKNAELRRMKHDLALSEDEVQQARVGCLSDSGFINRRLVCLKRLGKNLRRKRQKWAKKVRYQALRGISGYGEKPRYPLKWSRYLILFSTLAYPFLGGTTRTGSLNLGICTSDCVGIVELLTIFAESFYFSGTTFVSLSFGEAAPVGIAARMLAMIEGLLGAFLIALFVFTLGRKVNR